MQTNKMERILDELSTLRVEASKIIATPPPMLISLGVRIATIVVEREYAKS